MAHNLPSNFCGSGWIMVAGEYLAHGMMVLQQDLFFLTLLLWHRYDRSQLTFRQLEDIQFVGAMGPPGGGRNGITQRYSRHYNVVSMTAFDENNMTIIFHALVEWWMGKHNYPAALTKLSKQLVAATIDTYLRYAIADSHPVSRKSRPESFCISFMIAC